MTYELFVNTLVSPRLGEHVAGFPSFCPAVLEKIFVGFRVNPIWLPNHVNYDVIGVNILFLVDRWSYL